MDVRRERRKMLWHRQAQLRPLHRLDGESSSDDAVDDLACVARASGIGLDHGECAVCSHGISLFCGAKVLRNSLFDVIWLIYRIELPSRTCLLYTSDAADEV